MKLKVISDGTLFGTQIFDMDTGQALKNVKAVKWCLSADSITADVVIELVKVPVEVVGTTKKEEEKKNEVLQEQAKPTYNI
jgi:thymidylate kinase